MLDGLYRKRLLADLPRWQEQGFVTPEGARGIALSLSETRAAFGMSAIVALLGATLIGVGVIALVAANWDVVPRFGRFLVLMAALATAYAGAALLHGRGQPLFAQAALLMAGAVFAASIALVGQTYHLAGEFDDAVLLWTLGIAAGAALTRSSALAVLTVAGAVYWAGSVGPALRAPPHWAGLGLLLLGGALTTWLGGRFARVVALLALAYWIAMSVTTAADAYRWPPAGEMALLALIALAFWSLGTALAAETVRSEPLTALGHDMLLPAMVSVLVCLGLLQVAPKLGVDRSHAAWLPVAAPVVPMMALALWVSVRRRALSWLDALAAAGLGGTACLFAVWLPGDGFVPRLLAGALVLAACLWLLWLGLSGRQPGGRALGLTAFGLEIVYIYARTFGTVLDTAFALLGGGLLFLLLAVLLVGIDRRLSARRLAPASEASP